MSNYPLVKIQDGSLLGKENCNSYGVKFFSFQGIPYAKPPLGKYRFKAPQPSEPWAPKILNATRPKAPCYQRNVLDMQKIEGSEDCLYLNVYTPELLRYRAFPVMVWIHGGAFVTGSGSLELCGPKHLISQDVILVTFNYRVGMLGFISFQDESIKVPGNAGLKDQVMVLKWVKKNIINFGGDNRNVTLFGHSSGAACVHLHMLSPMSKGLFHKAILQSGCALNPWVNGILGSGRNLAEALNIEGNDEKMLFKIKKLPVEDIFQAQELITNENSVDFNWLCSPVVEKQKTTLPFLPDEPINIIRSGNFNKVPMIIGYTSRDGMYWDIFNRKINGKPDIITDFTTVVPNNLHAKRGNLINDRIAKEIEKFYYGPRVQQTRMGRHPRLKMLDPMYQMLTDVFFLRGIHSTVKNHHEIAPTCPIYYYRFSYETDLNVFKNELPKPLQRKYAGATHGDDLMYLFDTSLTSVICHRSKEERAIDEITKMWSNFASKGDPNDFDCPVNWNPVCRRGFQYLEIATISKMDHYPDAGRMLFWDAIYQNDARTKYL